MKTVNEEAIEALMMLLAWLTVIVISVTIYKWLWLGMVLVIINSFEYIIA